MSILVVGSVAFDSIRTPAGEVKRIIGGSAVHFSMAASLLSRINLVGVVGNDFGTENIDFLRSKKVDTDGLKVINEGLTFFWQGYYEKDMNQAFTERTDLNVFASFDPVVPPQWRKSRFVFLANIDPSIQLKLIDQLESPELIVCDTMNFWISSKREELLKVIRKADIMLLNEGEITQLLNINNLITAAAQLKTMGPKVVVIKKGSHGAMMFHDDIFIVPAFPVEKIVDPTGAGDSFAGGFISYLEHKGKVNRANLEQALAYASVVASFNVEDFGPRSLASRNFSEIKQRFNTLFKMTQYKKI